MSDREKYKNGEVIVESKKTPALKALYEKGLVGESYTTPEQDHIMVQTTNSYNNDRRNKEFSKAISYMAAKAKKELKGRPEPVFRRVNHLSLGDRFTALKEELRKLKSETIYQEPPVLSDEQYSALLSFSEEESDLRNRAMDIIDAWERRPLTFRYYFKYKTASINKTRLGKLKLHEKAYAYFMIALEYWRDND